MWIFTKNSFLSIVEDMNNSDRLLVRGRLDGDIEKMFPDHKKDVIKGAGTDYLYRAFIPREVVAKAIKNQVNNLDYSNFKSANSDSRQHHLMDIWDIMYTVQQTEGRFQDIYKY